MKSSLMPDAASAEHEPTAMASRPASNKEMQRLFAPWPASISLTDREIMTRKKRRRDVSSASSAGYCGTLARCQSYEIPVFGK